MNRRQRKKKQSPQRWAMLFNQLFAFRVVYFQDTLNMKQLIARKRKFNQRRKSNDKTTDGGATAAVPKMETG